MKEVKQKVLEPRRVDHEGFKKEAFSLFAPFRPLK